MPAERIETLADQLLQLRADIGARLPHEIESNVKHLLENASVCLDKCVDALEDYETL